MIEPVNSTTLAAIKTIIWYDMFDFPLTAMELWRFGFFVQPVSFYEVQEVLINLPRGMSGHGGFYFLHNRDEVVALRQKRYVYADAKIKKANKVVKLFRFIPWLKFVGLVNVYGAHNLKESGDIDLFIITAKNRLWLTRLFSVGIIKLLNLRPQPDDNRDKICLSFFISDVNLDLSRVRIAGDLYFAYLAHMVPLYNVEQAFEALMQANQWIVKELPNFSPDKIHAHRRVSSVLSKRAIGLIDWLLGYFETLAKAFQLKILAAPLRQLMNIDTRVMMSDDILKMHTNDRRQETNERYQKKLDEYFAENK